MSDELKPCPHCGNTDNVEVMPVWYTSVGDNYNVVCNWNTGGCGAMGGARRTEAEAIAAWNTRADDAPINEKHVPSLKESTEDTQALSDSREQLEADVREICWGHDFYRRDAQKRYLHERGLDVREDIVTTNYDGHVLATVIMHMLDRQASITERELCDRCSPYATAKDYLDTIDSLTAERDHFRKHVNWLIALIADIARKQPHTFDPEAPYETLDTIGDYLDELHGDVASLRAERDELRKQLAEKQHACDVQRDSFAKMERECAELRQMLSDAAEAI